MSVNPLLGSQTSMLPMKNFEDDDESGELGLDPRYSGCRAD